MDLAPDRYPKRSLNSRKICYSSRKLASLAFAILMANFRSDRQKRRGDTYIAVASQPTTARVPIDYGASYAGQASVVHTPSTAPLPGLQQRKTVTMSTGQNQGTEKTARLFGVSERCSKCMALRGGGVTVSPDSQCRVTLHHATSGHITWRPVSHDWR